MNVVKKVVESIKPRGITYYYSCGHSYFMSQQAVRDFVYGKGEDVPKQCPTCATETEAA